MKRISVFIICLSCILPSLVFGKDSKIIAEYKGGKLTSQEIQRKIDVLSENNESDTKINFDQLDQKTKENLVTNIIAADLLVKEAKKRNVQESVEYKTLLKQIENELLQKVLLNQIIAHDITEEKIKAKYQEMVTKKSDEEEVKASHILVDSEAEAKQISDLIKNHKANFGDLAKEKSKDPGSKVVGGELGYFTKGQMVKPFEDTVFSLAIGEVSKPIKTNFGWHIIKLNDKRKAAVPDYEKVRSNIKNDLESERIRKYIQEKIKEADIKFQF